MKKELHRHTERGNVLFLILIAVALFAALSYAVTQSSRSGGGDADRETNLVNSAQISQYPASIRTALLRLIISDGIDIGDLEFNLPSNFSNCGTPTNGTKGDHCVFHGEGGNVAYVQAPAEVLTGTTPGDWVFNGENEINLVGVTAGGDAPTAASAEVIAFLPNVSDSVCERINEELGIGTVGTLPVDSGIDVTTAMINTDGSSKVGLVSNAAGNGTIGEATTGSSAQLNSQGFGCFTQTNNYYYHVLIEQ